MLRSRGHRRRRISTCAPNRLSLHRHGYPRRRRQPAHFAFERTRPDGVTNLGDSVFWTSTQRLTVSSHTESDLDTGPDPGMSSFRPTRSRSGRYSPARSAPSSHRRGMERDGVKSQPGGVGNSRRRVRGPSQRGLGRGGMATWRRAASRTMTSGEPRDERRSGFSGAAPQKVYGDHESVSWSTSRSRADRVRPLGAERRRQDDDRRVLEGYLTRGDGEVAVLGATPRTTARASATASHRPAGERHRARPDCRRGGDLYGRRLLAPAPERRGDRGRAGGQARRPIATLREASARRLDLALGVVATGADLLDEPTTGFDT